MSDYFNLSKTPKTAFQAATKPAGMFDVLVSSSSSPSSSAGIPNSTSLASYTLIASLYALVACAKEYLRLRKIEFFASIASSIFLHISSMVR